MSQLASKFLIVALCLTTAAVFSQEGGDSKSLSSPIEDLGDDRYRIGNIIVNKAERNFTLGGKILHLGQPLEYLAVKLGGSKGYESLLELDTSATEFQLACILIGLDASDSLKPRYQFDERKVSGQAVDITINWRDGTARRSASAVEALSAAENALEQAEWIYIGSSQSPQDGSLQAELSGTLIGFVHDPSSIIEHSKGARGGSYGMITGNSEVLPPVGSAISLTVSVTPVD